MKYIFLMVLLLNLVGCSSMKSREVVEVKVPVIQPWPEPPQLNRPTLEINYITDEDLKNKNYDKIVKSLEITIQQLMDYSQKLEKSLDVYRQTPLK